MQISQINSLSAWRISTVKHPALTESVMV